MEPTSTMQLQGYDAIENTLYKPITFVSIFETWTLRIVYLKMTFDRAR